MADKPTTSRVGRPRSRSVSQTPKSAAKVGRPRLKSAQKPKAKGLSKKTAAPTKRAVRPIPTIRMGCGTGKSKTFWRSITRSSTFRFRTR